MSEEIKKFKNPIQVTKAYLPPIEEYIDKIKYIWNNNCITNGGPLHTELEVEIKNFLKVNNTVLYTNGHLALDIAIKSLGLKGEVITTPFTFASTIHALVMNGLKPVFCDINLTDYNIDVEKIEELISENTTAILPVHVFGSPCNVDKIESISKKYNLKVIYDAAHATGIEVDNKGIGSFGDISMFSFHATKVYNTIEGGVLAFKDKELRANLQLYKNFGITGKESIEAVGLNAKMSEFQAAMGLVNLKHLEDEIGKRKEIFNLYKENLKDIDGIYCLNHNENIKPNYAYFPILIDENKCISRNKLYSELEKYNVFTRKYFYPLATDYACYKDKYESKHLINAKYVSDRILTLPIYGSLEKDYVIKIVNIIKYLNNNK